MGNTVSQNGQDTNCPGCGTVVTERSGYKIKLQNLDEKGRCSKCGTDVYRHFISSSLKLS